MSPEAPLVAAGAVGAEVETFPAEVLDATTVVEATEDEAAELTAYELGAAADEVLTAELDGAAYELGAAAELDEAAADEVEAGAAELEAAALDDGAAADEEDESSGMVMVTPFSAQSPIAPFLAKAWSDADGHDFLMQAVELVRKAWSLQAQPMSLPQVVVASPVSKHV